MAVKQVFVPVGSVAFIRSLRIEAHDCGEDLGNEQDGKTCNEGGGRLGTGVLGFTLFM